MTIFEAFQAAVEHHRAGRLPDAELLYRQILEVEPNHTEALHLLGFMAHQVGKHEMAIEYIERAIRLNETSAAFHHNLGDTYRALKRYADAAICYRRALELMPGLVESLNNLGLVLYELGNLEEATACYERGLALVPNDADLHLNLGNARHNQKKLAEASACYRRAIELKADYAEAHCNLGNVLRDQGLFAEAVASYQRAIEIKPDFATGHNSLGNAWTDQDKLEEAIACYRRALQCDPHFAEAHSNLGLALQEQGKFEEAIACHQRALELKPENVKLHNKLGNALANRDDLDGAIACFQRALEQKPDHAETHMNLGQVFMRQGRWAEGLASFENAQALAPSDGLKIRMATFLPRIPSSRADIQKWRGRFQENLDRLEREPLSLKEPALEAAGTNFILAYHGFNDRDLQAQMAALYARSCPALNYVAPHCRSSNIAPSSARPLRIGFLSNFFQDHSVSRHYAGIIRHLARDDFRVILLAFANPEDPFGQFTRSGADEVVTLTRQMKMNLEALQQQVAAQQLDILFYTDIGMDPWTYFLAFARLAPVQCVGPGHPVTTGIPTIDYFISSFSVEPVDAEERYTERLVRLKFIPNYFYRPKLTGPPKSRGGFGLDADAHLYLCAQAPFKIHPDFDDLAAAILRADPKGRFLFIRGRDEDSTRLQMKRFQTGREDLMDRVQLLPRQGYEDYLQLLTLADALLDTPHFSGGTTSFQALGLGVPIVTLPGQFGRGRVTYGCYQRMGLEECIAADAEDYVRIALRLANDPGWREEVRGKILAASPVLFENQDVVREMEQFFIKAVAQACNTSV